MPCPIARPANGVKSELRPLLEGSERNPKPGDWANHPSLRYYAFHARVWPTYPGTYPVRPDPKHLMDQVVRNPASAVSSTSPNMSLWLVLGSTNGCSSIDHSDFQSRQRRQHRGSSDKLMDSSACIRWLNQAHIHIEVSSGLVWLTTPTGHRVHVHLTTTSGALCGVRPPLSQGHVPDDSTVA